MTDESSADRSDSIEPGAVSEAPERLGAGDRPRSRAQSKAWTRDRVLLAAQRVFAERGFETASITEIAEVAGVAVGSVYVHFANKRALFWAVLSDRLVDEQQIADAAIDGDLEAFVVGYGSTLDRDDAGMPTVALLAEAWLYSIRDESFRAEMAAHQRQVREVVAALTVRLRSRDQPDGVPEPDWVFTGEQIATIALSLLRSLRQARCVEPGSVTGEMFSTTMLHLLRLTRTERP